MKTAGSYRIAVVGIGGVGGFVGAMLAKHYENSSEVEVVFVARGENEKVIRNNGLKLITNEAEIIARPKAVTHQPVGVFDLIILCTKNYDLESATENIKDCIDEKTVIIPLLNGLSATLHVQQRFPQAIVCNGCIYIVSNLVETAVVKESRGDHTINFGIENTTNEQLRYAETILKNAGLNATLTTQITEAVWEKFIFLSPLATLTSYLDATGGEIAANAKHLATFKQLVMELKAIADAMTIPLRKNIVELTLDKVIALQRDSRTSMNLDFRKGGKTEVDTLTAYVVNLGKQLNLSVTTYEKLLNDLKSR